MWKCVESTDKKGGNTFLSAYWNPCLPKLRIVSKFLKLATYLPWRTKCRSVKKEKSMSEQLSVETMVCSEYQRLLEESQSSLEIWREHRAEICRARLIGKEAGDELLRLQAKYARDYTLLQNHEHNCLRCQLMSRIATCVSGNSSDTLSDTTLYV
jgi:hypothetical protein